MRDSRVIFDAVLDGITDSVPNVSARVARDLARRVTRIHETIVQEAIMHEQELRNAAIDELCVESLEALDQEARARDEEDKAQRRAAVANVLGSISSKQGLNGAAPVRFGGGAR